LGKALGLWLNQAVRSRITYHLRKSRKKARSRLLWLLALIGLGVAAWVWWHPGKPTGPEPKPTPIPAPPPTQGVPPPKPAPIPAPPPTQGVPPPKPAPIKVQPEVPPPVVPIPPARPITKTNAEPLPPGIFPRPVQNIFEAQLAMARQGISSGSLDGLVGSQTRAALRAYQQKERLPVTGELDLATKERLLLATPIYAAYTVTTSDLGRLQPLSSTWLGKSQQTALDYETILELVAERSHSHPNLIRRLNPAIDWANVAAGTTLQMPDVAYADVSVKAAFATISLGGKVCEAFDANANLLAHFPCSIAQRVEKRPIGELHVAVVAPNPNYTFDPDVFPESAEARQLKRKLVLPPGPNNPVGVAWVGLDKPGYGIHGTPSPELVGRTESHGCFRLANWNADYLLKLVWIGMPVQVVP
jgi:lipoprotein-anchoring transpeptidase ErfK/SrfK